MDYSDVIRYFLDPANGYSKEELYEAYLDVTVRFLEELISAGTYESQIIACFGEEGGSEIIEKVAAKTPPIPEEVESGPITDKAEKIKAMLRYYKNNFDRDQLN
ncbi:MAG: hypothetical protein J5786_00160 [Clostridiales bacterium]|nr:hypothetical protein [Clostridiales bacterium]